MDMEITKLAENGSVRLKKVEGESVVTKEVVCCYIV